MYEQLFLMYVIPSVMVQSYICYVTKPVVEVELSKFSDFSLILSVNVGRGGGKVIREKGQHFDSSNAAYIKDRNSDLEAVSN